MRAFAADGSELISANPESVANEKRVQAASDLNKSVATAPLSALKKSHENCSVDDADLSAKSQIALESAATQAVAKETSASEVPPPLMQSDAEIIRIDHLIEKELLDFARFNISYFKTTTGTLSKKVYGYALARQAGTAVAFGGTLTELSERARTLNDVGKFSKSARRHALICSSIGNAISAEASTLELGQNLWAIWYARKRGCISSQAADNVAERLKRINVLFEKRDAVLAGEPDPSVREVELIEGRLLQRVKQQLLYEFRKWTVSSREQAAKENFFYALDAMQNYLGMGSNLLSLRSFHSPQRSAAAAITLLIANSAATLNPPLSNLAGYLARGHQRRFLLKKFDTERPQVDKALSVAELQKIEKNDRNSRLLEETLFICKNAERMDQNIDFEASEIQRLRQIAQQQAIAGPLIGLTSVARSILVTDAYFGYRRDRLTSNRLLFAGRISQATGQAYALWDTPRTIYKGYKRRKRLAAEGRLPSQMLERRLTRLDLVEERLKHSD